MSFDHLLLSRLQERDRVAQSNNTLVEAFRDLASQAIMLKERNRVLLHASKAGSTGHSGGDDTVRAALLSSVEAQLTQAKLELAEQYKIQSSNAQRLLALTDSLREAEERGREERDESRRSKSELEALRERAKWYKEVVAEKEKQLLILQDDHNSLELELSQVTIQNENLKIDNASLLSRWLESKTEEISRMNEANAFLESTKRQKEQESKINE